MAVLPTGTVTFLFTDIEGSTQMWERNASAMRSALALHDEVLRSVIEEHGGHVFKTIGDAFCAAFSSAPEALGAAISAQRALHDEQWKKGASIRVRAALHTGAVDERGGDYFGPPVNRVSRLLSAGHGGQTLLSLATQELVRDALPVDARLEDLGERRLKDLFRPERVFQISVPDLPSEFPPLRTLESVRNNLSPQATPLIGREREVKEVCDRLQQQEVRLLTLTGPGGTGKTRLALQAAADMLEDFEDGVFFVALSDVNDTALVPITIAGALGLQESGDVPLEDILKEYLRRRELLLLLDNFEQVLRAGPLVGELLSVAPRLKVLVTSRAALRVYGEQEYPVPPLALPDPGRLPPVEKLERYEAVRLFTERARAVKPGFVLDDQIAPAVAEICARLDGLPLAIELAAARTRLLPPKAMLKRLGDRLKLLTGGARDLPGRQQTLQGAIDWSYDLLDEGDRRLFRRMSVFSGGRTLDAVEAICDAEGDLDVYEGVESLLEKSLIRQEEGPEEEPRFVMLETIHEYAREKLEQSGEAAEVRQAHADYFLSLAEEAEPEVLGPQQIEWMDRLEAEHDNLRAALSWYMEGTDAEPALRMAGALGEFWLVRGHFSEGRGWCEDALAKDTTLDTAHASGARAKALERAGAAACRQSDYEMAEKRGEESLALYRELGDKRGEAISLRHLGITASDLQDYERASALLSESASISRTLGDKASLGETLNSLGILVAHRGDLGGANTIYEEALVLARVSGNIHGLALITGNVGVTAMLEGDHEKAQALIEEASELSLAEKDRLGHAISIHNLGLLALLGGEPDRAAVLCAQSIETFVDLLYRLGVTFDLDALGAASGQRGDVPRAALLWGAAEAMREAMGVSRPEDEAEVVRPFVEAARSRLGEAAFLGVWEEGRLLSQDQAVTLALAEQGRMEHTAEAEPAWGE